MTRKALAICLIVVSSALGGSLVAADKPFISTPVSEFLKMSGTHQQAYLSGALDALFYVSRHGVPPRHIRNCLFYETWGDPPKIFYFAQVYHHGMQVPEEQKESTSPVSVLVDWVDLTCSAEASGRPNSR